MEALELNFGGSWDNIFVIFGLLIGRRLDFTSGVPSLSGVGYASLLSSSVGSVPTASALSSSCVA